MKYLFQMLIILAVSFVGELLSALIPLPVPASIYGLVLMLLLLMTGALRLSAVEETADFLVGIMPVMFVPAVVGLMSSWSELKVMLPAVLIAVTIVTALVMAAAGTSAQAAISLRERSRK